DDAGDAIGTDGLKQVANRTELPTAGIGGITEKNYKSCLENGADGICVISAITQSDNIEQTVTALLQ
ncbi:MAG: thiamine phosphate synthase, partial [Jeotgalicoccus sp.]